MLQVETNPNNWGVPVKWKTITLSDHESSFFTIVDEELYDELRQWKWNIYDYGGCLYAKRSRQKYPNDIGEPAAIYLHRWIAKRYLKRPSNSHFVVDHVNGKGLDNRLINLRWATPRDNNLNVHGFWFYSNEFQKELEEAKNNNLWYLSNAKIGNE